MKVTNGTDTLLTSDFATGIRDWTPLGGHWEAGDGVLKQTDTGKNFHLTAGSRKWADYTIHLKARKTGGEAGFLVMFHVQDRSHFGWFNLGGLKNTAAAVQMAAGGEALTIGAASPFVVETGRWYDIRVELNGLDIKCYVDDKLIVHATDTPLSSTDPLFAAASRVDTTGEVILKVVNAISIPEQINIDMSSLGPVATEASLDLLQGDPESQNSVENPDRIAPQHSQIENVSNKFAHEFPGNSISVIRFKSHP